jgi:hypothetical protein
MKLPQLTLDHEKDGIGAIGGIGGIGGIGAIVGIGAIGGICAIGAIGPPAWLLRNATA